LRAAGGAADHEPRAGRPGAPLFRRWGNQVVVGVLVTLSSAIVISGATTGWKWVWGDESTSRRTVSIDDLHSASGWSPYADADSSLTLDSSSGAGRPFALDFTLARSGFVGITNDVVPGTLSGTRSITFRYEGTGAPNTIEFKLLYAVEAGKAPIFGGIWRHVSDTNGKWRTIEVPYSKFTCWPATGCRDGEPVVPGRVVKVDFAVSNKPAAGDVAGAGSVAFEGLAAVRED
jgi:hypothetical protein